MSNITLQANKIWQTENAYSYSDAKGKLVRACRAFKINIKENDMGVWLLSQEGEYITHVLKEGTEK